MAETEARRLKTREKRLNRHKLFKIFKNATRALNTVMTKMHASIRKDLLLDSSSDEVSTEDSIVEDDEPSPSPPQLLRICFIPSAAPQLLRICFVPETAATAENPIPSSPAVKRSRKRKSMMLTKKKATPKNRYHRSSFGPFRPYSWRDGFYRGLRPDGRYRF